jgi:hypothetical protein
MRALVVSDTHFGAWAGRDQLREEPSSNAWRRSGRDRRADLPRRLFDFLFGSRQAYARYLRYAWPGTAIVIDDEPEPRMLELLADLNPLRGGIGLPNG